MIRKKVDELQGNEILSKPLMTWDYQIILPEGALIRPDYIEKIKDLGVIDVWVQDPYAEEINDVGLLRKDITCTAKQKVKDILERHTYQNNEDLEEIAHTADHIISNILEKEQVVEQIFDIRQRSSDLYEHSISICSLAILTALKLKLPEYKIHEIGVGCLLHEIGLRYQTVDFSDRDLQKATLSEASEYKKHPVLGYNALKNEDWLGNISKSIVLFHHERLDGSGYPLRTKDIPFECQLVAVCDVFDEMICGIGYERMKVYEAIEYLKAYKNVWFPSKVVDTFLSFTAVYPSGTRVVTNEGEIGVVVAQNKEFQDRPILRMLKDKNGKEIQGEVMKDLVKVHNIFIERTLD